jgi:hypothetical protein
MQIIKYAKQQDLEGLLKRPMHDFAVIEKPVQEI